MCDQQLQWHPFVPRPGWMPAWPGMAPCTHGKLSHCPRTCCGHLNSPSGKRKWGRSSSVGDTVLQLRLAWQRVSSVSTPPVVGMPPVPAHLAHRKPVGLGPGLQCCPCPRPGLWLYWLPLQALDRLEGREPAGHSGPGRPRGGQPGSYH